LQQHNKEVKLCSNSVTSWLKNASQYTSYLLKNIFLLGWKFVSTFFLPAAKSAGHHHSLEHPAAPKKTKTDALKSFPIFPLRLSERAERKTNSSPRRIGKP
jgi:hypothetical protein